MNLYFLLYRRRGFGRHPLDHARQAARDRKPLNSADATYDLGMSGVYARNVAFESSSRRRPGPPDDDDSTAGVTESGGGGAGPATARNDNEYEYVWDASAVAARAPRPGQLHRGKTTETGCGGNAASTSFGGGRPGGERGGPGSCRGLPGSCRSCHGGAEIDLRGTGSDRSDPGRDLVYPGHDSGRSGGDQCRCMSETTRTMPRQASHPVDSTTARYRNEKPAPAPPRHRTDKTVTLGRFGHLESRSAARSAGSGAGAKGQRQGRSDDFPRRVCPHCGHQSSTTPSDGAACGAGTPPARVDNSLTLPRRQASNQSTIQHRRA